MTNNYVLQAGEVQIEEVQILKAGGDGMDVMEQVDHVIIHEDMYSPFITGHLVMFDTLDIPGIVGRSGRDLLWLKILTPSIAGDKYIRGYFHIYKIGAREAVRDRAQQYNIYFTSEESLVDATVSISKTFSGAPHDIAKTVVEKHLQTAKKLIVEPTSNIISYTSNFWSPTKNLTYCAEHAIGEKKNSNILMFENREGFNFTSFDKLSSKDVSPIQNFAANDFSASINTESDNKITFGKATKDPITDYKTVQEIRVDTTFDFLRDYHDGMIKTKLYAHDLTTKRLNIRKFDLANDTLELMNNNKHYRDSVIASMDPRIMFMSMNNNVAGKGDVTDYLYKQKRISQLKQLMSSVIEIDVFGRTDYTVGKKVSVDINRLANIEKNDSADEYLDKYYSGNYVITAIAHHISRVQHKCTLELSKSHTMLK